LPSQGLYLDLPTGEVVIEGGLGDQVSAELVVECGYFSSRCRDQAETLSLVGRNYDGRLMLRVEGIPEGVSRRPKMTLRLKVPRERAIDIDLAVGGVDIYGMGGDLAIDVGVGDVDVQIAERDVRSILLGVGVGGADLTPSLDNVASAGFLFLGQEVEWRQGLGQADVMVDVGVGEVDVRLN
jgi:hypothetical protein